MTNIDPTSHTIDTRIINMTFLDVDVSLLIHGSVRIVQDAEGKSEDDDYFLDNFQMLQKSNILKK